MKRITVLVGFTEVRSGRTYQPGDVVTDPQWHEPNSRRAEAYAAKGWVKIEEVEEASPGMTPPNPFAESDEGQG